jgi:uncharacterized membrane protein (DUF2068 family)
MDGGLLRWDGMTSYRPVLAAIHVVMGVLAVLPVLVLTAVFGGVTAVVGAASHDTTATTIVGLGLGTVLIIVMAVTTVLGLLSLAAGVGLWRKEAWGDVLALVVSALHLFNFPVGTALAAFGFWVLLVREPAARLAQPRIDELAF